MPLPPFRPNLSPRSPLLWIAVISGLWLAGEWAPGRPGSPELGDLGVTALAGYLSPWPDPVHSLWFILATFGLIATLIPPLRRGPGPARIVALLGLITATLLVAESVLGWQKRVLAPPGRAVTLAEDPTLGLQVDRAVGPDRVWLSFRPAGQRITRELETGDAVAGGVWKVRFLGKGGQGPDRYVVRVRDREERNREEVFTLKLNEPVSLRGGKQAFRVLQYLPQVEEFGAGVQIRYEPKVLPVPRTEDFWIFQRYPGFNASHRPKSRHTFELVEQLPGEAPMLSVRRGPLRNWIYLLIAATVLAWAGPRFRGGRRSESVTMTTTRTNGG